MRFFCLLELAQAQAVRVATHQAYVTTYRATFPPDPTSSVSSSSSIPDVRTLYTILSPSSPFAYALFPASPSSAEDKGKGREDGLLVGLTPPGSLNSLLAVTKSPFLLSSSSAKAPNPNSGPVRCPSLYLIFTGSAFIAGLTAPCLSAAPQVTDMTPSNSSRNTRPTAQMLKLEGQTSEIPYSRSSPFIPGLTPPPDGMQREVEYVVRASAASGSGGLGRGLLVEVEWFPLNPPQSEREETEAKEKLGALMKALVPQEGGGSRVTVSEVVCESAEDLKAVERGRRSAGLLLDLLKTDRVI